MDEIELLKKKTGMTIGTAWLLMLFSVLFVALIGYLIGLYIMTNAIEVRPSDLLDYSSIGLTFSFFIFSVIGFYINKKEYPRNDKITWKIFIVAITTVLLWSFLSSLLTEFYDINIEMYNQRKITSTWWFGIILSGIMAIFQIGILGHGLIRNYPFKKALVAISFVCIAFYIPVAVVSMVIQTSLLFLIYYRSGSFFLVLVSTWTIYLSDYSLRKILEIRIPNFNYYKNVVFSSESTYYIFCVAAFLLLIASLFILKRISPKIQWQKEADTLFF